MLIIILKLQLDKFCFALMVVYFYMASSVHVACVAVVDSDRGEACYGCLSPVC